MRRSRAPRVTCATLAIGLSVAGCGPIGWVRVTVNHPLDAHEVAFIVPGKTTWDEVTGRLGAPDRLVSRHDGLIADYQYSDSKYFRINPGWLLGFITPVSYAPHDLGLSVEGTKIETFQVAFDSRQVVQYAGFRRGEAASQAGTRRNSFSNVPRPRWSVSNCRCQWALPAPRRKAPSQTDEIQVYDARCEGHAASRAED
jgi:hypothetical protein